MKNLRLSRGRVANAACPIFLQNPTGVLEFESFPIWDKKNLQLIKSMEIVMEEASFYKVCNEDILEPITEVGKMNSGPDQNSVMGKSERVSGMFSRK